MSDSRKSEGVEARTAISISFTFASVAGPLPEGAELAFQYVLVRKAV
jgi:hypothetical protein